MLKVSRNFFGISSFLSSSFMRSLALRDFEQSRHVSMAKDDD